MGLLLQALEIVKSAMRIKRNESDFDTKALVQEHRDEEID